MHVAVAGMHVQRHEHPAFQYLLVDRVAALQDRLVLAPGEDAVQFGAHFLFP